MTRDQLRAQRAYQTVAGLNDGEVEEFKIAVNALGANTIRSGLAAALAVVRRNEQHTLAQHLLQSDIPGFQGAQVATLHQHVCALELAPYMLASSETLLVVTWLKRAVQARKVG